MTMQTVELACAGVADAPTASFPLHVRSFDEKARSATFIASTDAEDSYGEVVEQSWVLDRYRANPVILYAHQRDGSSLPIGQATRVGVVEGKLEVDAKFASAAANPFAENVWQSLVEGTLRAVSVGFRPGDVRLEKRNGKEVMVLRNNVLYEISVVPIGANAEALAKMRARALAASKSESPESEDPMPLSAEEETRLRSDLATREKSLVDANAKIETLEKTVAEEKKRADEARAGLVKLELDALVGKKLLPAEAEDLAALAMENPARYTKMLSHVKARPDLTVLDKTKMGDDPDAAKGRDIELADPAQGSHASQSLDAEIATLA